MMSNICDKPFNLEFAVTNMCNCRCIQCSVWKDYLEKPERIREELTTKEIEKIFSSYKGFSIIGITGGEPYMRRDLSDILSVIASNQPRLRMLFITTNGQFPGVTEGVLKKFLEMRLDEGWGFDVVQMVSLDGPKEIHDKIRGVNGAYDKVMETIEIIHKLRGRYDALKFGTVTVLSPYNIDRIEGVFKKIEGVVEEFGGEPSFCVWFVGQLYKNYELFREVDVEGFRRKLMEYLPRAVEVVGRGSALTLGRRAFYLLLSKWLKRPDRQVIPCMAARVRCFLDPYGNLYPCTIADLPIGNLREHRYDFESVFKSGNRRRVRRLVEVERCPVCCNTCETIPAMMAQPLKTAMMLLEAKLVSR
jgi:radical SAM protein with 4Fe4S-binding SPASM domain